MARGEDHASDVFAWLHAVSRSTELTHLAVRVGLILSHYFSKAEGAAWPKLTTLATTCGAHPDGVRKALLQLRAAGFLEIIYGAGRADLNRYVMVRQGSNKGRPPSRDEGTKPPTTVCPSEDDTQTAVGPSEVVSPDSGRLKPPTAVCKNPRQPGRYGTTESEPLIKPLNLPVVAHSGSDRLTEPKAKPKRTLPDGFPTLALINAAQARFDAEGLAIDAHLEATKFVGHHRSKGSRFVSWEDAWSKTWTSNAIDYQRQRQSIRNGGGRYGRADNHEGAFRGAPSLLEKRREH